MVAALPGGDQGHNRSRALICGNAGSATARSVAVAYVVAAAGGVGLAAEWIDDRGRQGAVRCGGGVPCEEPDEEAT